MAVLATTLGRDTSHIGMCRSHDPQLICLRPRRCLVPYGVHFFPFVWRCAPWRATALHPTRHHPHAACHAGKLAHALNTSQQCRRSLDVVGANTSVVNAEVGLCAAFGDTAVREGN